MDVKEKNESINDLKSVTADLKLDGVTPKDCDIKNAVAESIKEDGTLTDDQLNTIINTLADNRDIVSEVGVIDTSTGEVLEEDYLPMNADSETGNLSFDVTAADTEKASESFKNIFGASDEDMIAFINVVNRYKSGEKFSVYNALPDCFKKVVMAVCASQGADRRYYNTVAKEFLIEQFVQSEEMNNAFDSFNRELEDIYAEIPSMSDMYADTLYQSMTDDLQKKADMIKDSNPEGAERLLKISDVFKDTYEFTSIKEFIASKKYLFKVMKDIRKGKFDDEMKNFNFLLSKSNLFKWPDVTAIKDILNRKLSGMNDYQIKVFMLSLYYSRLGIDLNDVYEAEYTYYTLRNIIALDFAEGSSEFNTKLVENLQDLMNFIKDICAN